MRQQVPLHAVLVLGPRRAQRALQRGRLAALDALMAQEALAPLVLAAADPAPVRVLSRGGSLTVIDTRAARTQQRQG